MKKIFLSFLLTSSVLAFADAQEVMTEDHHRFPHFRIAGLIGHTLILTHEDHTIISSWGLDMEYWFHPNWGIGLHNDVEIQSFVIERAEGELLKREYPLVLTIDALYKFDNGFVVQLGPGYEIEKNENFFLIRAGVEYEIEMKHHWDISPTFFFDNRFEANNTWTFALGVGKRF